MARLKNLCRAVVVRTSFGRDFGAWRDVLSTGLVRRDQVQELLLVNDSVLGPIRPVEPLFERMRRAEGLWGLVNSDQNGAEECSRRIETSFASRTAETSLQKCMAFRTRDRAKPYK